MPGLDATETLTGVRLHMGTKTGSSLLDLTGIYTEEDVEEIETALEEKAERDRQQRRDAAERWPVQRTQP